MNDSHGILLDQLYLAASDNSRDRFREGGPAMFIAARLVGLLTLTLLVLSPGSTSADEVTVKLRPQNKSGESGTAKLADTPDGKTKVTVSVKGQPAGVAQPMHIHKGTCKKLDPAPAYGLPNLVDGKADATIDVSLKTLQAGQFAINGHKSAQEVPVYVLCGDIPKKK